MARRVALLLALALTICLPSAAWATQSVKLSATFTPERLGRRTTLRFAFHVSAPAGGVPSALTGIDLSYPNYLGIALSGLGLATCTETTLQAVGLAGCPADSIMGHGSALAEVALGPALVRERAPVTILRAPDREGHLALLFDAVGTTPLDARVVFSGTLLGAPAPFGGTVDIAVPLVASIPDAPDVALVQLQAALGPSGVTYYEQVAGRTLAYEPNGLLLPTSCPRGGFPFAVKLSFLDGSQASAHTAVPCPAQGQSRSASRH